LKRIVRWLVLLLLIAGLAIVVVAVPLGGRTVLERISGETPGPDKQVRTDAGTPRAAGRDSDGLTAKDRRGLEQLIDEKMKADQGGGE